MIRFDLELLKIYWFVGKNNQIVCLGFFGIKKKRKRGIN